MCLTPAPSPAEIQQWLKWKEGSLGSPAPVTVLPGSLYSRGEEELGPTEDRGLGWDRGEWRALASASQELGEGEDRGWERKYPSGAFK